MAEMFYFDINLAKTMIFPYQKVFLTRLESILSERHQSLLEDVAVADADAATDAGCAAQVDSASSSGARNEQPHRVWRWRQLRRADSQAKGEDEGGSRGED